MLLLNPFFTQPNNNKLSLTLYAYIQPCSLPPSKQSGKEEQYKSRYLIIKTRANAVTLSSKITEGTYISRLEPSFFIFFGSNLAN